MEDDDIYLIVNVKALPEVFEKVVQVKKIMETERVRTIQEAVNLVGISRSVFYKYRDSVFAYNETKKGKTIIIAMNLEDLPGLLSNVLNVIASCGANILTINQTIPIQSIANVTLTIETGEAKTSEMMEKIKQLAGVQRIKILAH